MTYSDNTKNELHEICASIAREVEAYASGSLRYCDECGEWIEPDELDDCEACPHCGSNLDDAEVSSVYDYLDRDIYAEHVVMDVIGYKPTYYGVKLLVACGGPNIWIDTVNGEVCGYWGCDEARVWLDRGTRDAIDELEAEHLEILGMKVSR